MSLVHSSPKHPPARTMIFIDGGYLKHIIKDLWKSPLNKFHFGKFPLYITENALGGLDHSQIIRMYFYDGLADPSDSDYEKQKEFHDYLIGNFRNYEVKVGRLVRDGKNGFRQKGVDVLMAIDMIEKANSNQYDIAIVIAGDLDHLEAVKTIRNKGKQVFVVFFGNSISKELLHNCDDHYELDEDDVAEMAKRTYHKNAKEIK